MANLLTGIRLLLVVPAALSFANADLLSPIILVVIMIVAIVTDYYDGKLARYTGTASARGQIFDHSTDFLFVTCGLAGAAVADVLTPILPVLIVIAFAQYVLDSYFFYHEKQLHMSFLGRWNGIFYFVPLCAIALSRLEVFTGISTTLILAAAVMGWLLVVSTLLSIADRAIAPLRAHKKPS